MGFVGFMEKEIFFMVLENKREYFLKKDLKRMIRRKSFEEFIVE